MKREKKCSNWVSLRLCHLNLKTRNQKIISSLPPTMEDDEQEDIYRTIPQPLRADWFVDFVISFHADLIYNALLVLTSMHRSYRRAAAAVTAAETAVKTAPSRATRVVARAVRRTWFGVLGACHVSMVLVLMMAMAAVAGVGLVNMYVEEPVAVRERLFFDYTEVNPSALFWFETRKKPVGGVPVGHMIHVSLLLLMPESDFNRDIGLFQLKTELLSSKGETISKSSQPCMLTFRSRPIRLARTFAMSVPLVAGVTTESQKMKVDALKHKEKSPRTKAVRVTLLPRARTLSLPQLYEAEIVINSRPPWMKRLVYSWKWTLCVWTSLFIYFALLVALLCCCRQLLFPSRTSLELRHNMEGITKEQERMEGTSEAREEVMRRWRERKRRKGSIST
ncbi:PREDICTED: seipin-1 [Tarenaya hassleriana]|uniref:seipin-1 n=1 Tax=Tarenaya hassleriana TaxID=28532 RepID=UPI00053C4DD3|nr:PREDICTED: seipin-1 [Tarenaya hassleriana]